MFISFIHLYARTKEKIIKVIVKYLKVLPYLKSDGIVSPRFDPRAVLLPRGL